MITKNKVFVIISVLKNAQRERESQKKVVEYKLCEIKLTII